MKILLVTSAPANLLHFANCLSAACQEPLLRASHGQEALEKVSRHKPGLVIVDEHLQDGPALEFLRRLIALDAFVNVAVISDLPAEQFHEAYEGLGVLAQLPLRPGMQDATGLLSSYRQVAIGN
jgi:DNA-binding NarL/FixJ family response regulator